MTPRAVTVLAASVVLAGCGGDHDAAPRDALRTFLDRLAAGDVRGVCAASTPVAVGELRRDFGGRDCVETIAAVALHLRSTPEQRRALERARILEQGDVPLSPAPTRAAANETRFRVQLRDPVVRRIQKLDVTLRREGDRWRVDAGVAALFTLLTPP